MTQQDENTQHPPVQYSYRDAQGHLLFERAADGSLTVYYPGTDKIYSRRNADGGLTVYNEDGSEKSTMIGQPFDETKDFYPNGNPIRENVDGNEIIYGPDGQKLLVLDDSGATYLSDGSGRAGVEATNVRSIEMSASGCKITTENGFGEYVIGKQWNAPHLVREADVNGNVTAYDAEGTMALKTKTDGNGGKIIEVYRKDGTLMSSTDSAGIKTVYDEKGERALYTIDRDGIVRQMREDATAAQRQADEQTEEIRRPRRNRGRTRRQQRQTPNETNIVSDPLVTKWLNFPRNGGR